MTERDLIRICPLFKDVPESGLDAALALYEARHADFAKGAAIANAGSRLDRFGLVLKGSVQVSSEDIDGSVVIMNAVPAGGTFGESLCWLSVPEIPVRVTALSDSRVLWLSPDFFRSDELPGEPLRRLLRGNFISHLASRTLSMNDRIQILSRLSLREKLAVFFSLSSKGGTVRSFDVPFDRESLAVYLGVNRSALSRELAKMKREGIIDYYKNSFRLL